MKAYYFIPKAQADEILECGLEIRCGVSFSPSIQSGSGKCFPARLHPGDYRSEEFSSDTVCLKIDLDKVRAFVAEEAFLEADIPEDKKVQWFEQSVLPVQAYKLGSYRKPLCLIVNTILPQAMGVYDRVMDEALLYENSEELYLSQLFCQAQEDDAFRETALRAYMDLLAENGSLQAHRQQNTCVYFDMKTGRPYILKKG